MLRIEVKYFSAFLFTLSYSVVSLGQNQLVSSRQLSRVAEQTQVLQKAELAQVNTLPLFGERAKNLTQKAADEVFLKSCEGSFKNRKEACQFFCERGWEYLAEGQLDTAMYRFNLAYLLHPKCSDAYWGMGVVCFQQGKMEEATRVLGKGLEQEPNNAGLMADLATLNLTQYKENKDSAHLIKALGLLTKSVGIDATNATAFLRLALAEYYREDYEKSWEYLHRCRMLDVAALDTEFLKDLLAKQPDPVGMFK